MNGSILDPRMPLYTPDLVNRQHPLNRGRVAWWLTLPHLWGGRQWFDLMGLSPAVLTNMAAGSGWTRSYAPGSWGDVKFDGTNDYAPATWNGYAFDRLNPFTIGFTCRPTNLTAIKIPIAKMDNSTFKGWNVVQNYDGASNVAGRQVLQLIFNSSTNLIQVWAATSLNDGGYHRYLLTYDGSSGASGVAIYEDGKPLAVTIRTDTLTSSIANSEPITIGDRSGGTHYPFAGYLNDISLWSRKLGAPEVWSDYDLSRRGYPGALNRWQAICWSIPSGDQALSASDSAAGVDSASLAAAISALESGTGLDAATLATAFTAAETASGVDAGALAAALAASDSGGGTDSAALAAAMASSDAGIGLDAASLQAALTALESALGSDSGAAAANLTGSDSGSGADAGSVNGNAALTGTDLGAGADAGTLATALQAAETASGLDAATIVVSLLAQESGTAVEGVSAAIRQQIDELGRAADAAMVATGAPGGFRSPWGFWVGGVCAPRFAGLIRASDGPGVMAESYAGGASERYRAPASERYDGEIG